MKKFIQKFKCEGFMVLIILLSFLLFSPNLVLAEKPPVIHLGLIADFSGPYAPSTGATKTGALDALVYVNKELNGVKGVKIKALVRDSSNNKAKGLAFFNELINAKPKPLFFYMSESPLAQSLRSRFVEEGIIAMEPGSVSNIYPAGNVFGDHPLYPEMLAFGLKWLKDTWKKQRNPRVGIITWDTSFGRAMLTDEFFAYVKKIGVDIVDTQLYGVRDVDIAVQMVKLRNKKCDWLLTNTIAGGTLIIKKAAKEMGWDINLINVWTEWGTVRLGPHLFEGDIAVLNTKSFDEENDPSIKTLMKHFTKNNRTIKERTIFYALGWCETLLAQHVIETTVTRYGWEGLNVDNMKKVMFSLKDFRPLGGLITYGFTEKRRTPTKARIYRISGGKLLPETDFLEVADLRAPKYR